jgi:hypothetical protein
LYAPTIAAREYNNKNNFADTGPLLRTTANMQQLLRVLTTELSRTPAAYPQTTPVHLKGQQAVARQLPKLDNKPTKQDFVTAVQGVDSLLQGLIMDTAIVNTTRHVLRMQQRQSPLPQTSSMPQQQQQVLGMQQQQRQLPSPQESSMAQQQQRQSPSPAQQRKQQDIPQSP